MAWDKPYKPRTVRGRMRKRFGRGSVGTRFVLPGNKLLRHKTGTRYQPQPGDVK